MRTANGGPRGGAQTPLPQSYTSAKDRRSPWLRKLRLLKQHRILSHPGGTQPPHPLPCPGTARLGHSVPDYCPPQEDRKLPSHRNTCEGGVPEDSGCGCGLDRGKPNFGLKFCSHGPRGLSLHLNSRTQVGKLQPAAGYFLLFGFVFTCCRIYQCFIPFFC